MLLSDHGAVPGSESGLELQAALDAGAGGRIEVPPGRWISSRSLTIAKATHLIGDFAGGPYARSRLEFGDGVHGVVVLPGADWTVLENLQVAGQWKTIPDCDGIVCEAKTTIRGCWIRGFSRHGVVIRGDSRGILAGHDGTLLRNTANLCVLSDLQIDLCDGDGLHLEGLDANAGLIQAVSVTENGRWGINDQSALGNAYVACHARSNRAGPYRMQGGVNASTLLGCYAEGDQPPCDFGGMVSVFGGTLGSGHIGGQAVVVPGQSHLLLHSAGGAVAPLAVMDHPALKAPLVGCYDANGTFRGGLARDGTYQFGGQPYDDNPRPAALRISIVDDRPVAEFGFAGKGYNGSVGTWEVGADGEGFGAGFFRVNAIGTDGKPHEAITYRARPAP